MIEVQLVNSQSADTTDTALTASSDVLSAAGFSVDDLFSPGSNYESTLNMLQENGVDTEEAMAMVAFAQGLASKNDAAMDAFSTALQRYQTQVNSQSSRYKEIKATYETDEKVQAGADTLRDLLKQLYGGNFTGEDVLGGVSMSTSFFPSGKESSKKKRAFRTALLLSLVLVACGPEAPQAQTETIIFNGEYVLQAERAPIGVPMSGLLSDKDGNLIDINGNTITPVQQGDQMRYVGVYAVENYKFQFASAKAVSNKDSSKIGEVVTLRQIDKNNETGAELFLAQTDSPDVFKLIDQYNKSDLYTISLKGNKIILTDIESQKHYLITDAIIENEMATPGATDSPEALVNKIKDMFALYTVAEAKGFDATPTVLASNTPLTPVAAIPTETPMSTETPVPEVGVPAGIRGTDAEGNDIVTMENGDIARKYEYKTQSGEVLWSGWAVEKGVIPGLDYSDADLIPLSLLVSYDTQGGHNIASLTHENNMDAGISGDNLTSVIQAELYQRAGVSTTDQQKMLEYRLSILGGTALLPFTTYKGENVNGKLGPETGFKTIVVPFESLVPAAGNGISEWRDLETGISFRSITLGVDKSGNIISLIASEKPLNDLPDRLVRELVLFFPANIIKTKDQSAQSPIPLVSIFTKYADKGSSETTADIGVVRNP